LDAAEPPSKPAIANSQPTNAGEAFVSVREPVKVWAAVLKRIEQQWGLFAPNFRLRY
jgi:hypothetical protein